MSAVACCPHGVESGSAGPFIFNGPVGTCRCCGEVFGYIGAMTMTEDYYCSVNPDRTLCYRCGGTDTVDECGWKGEQHQGRENPKTGEYEWETIPAGWVDSFEPGSRGGQRSAYTATLRERKDEIVARRSR